jgi:hypothetical protein
MGLQTAQVQKAQIAQRVEQQPCAAPHIQYVAMLARRKLCQCPERLQHIPIAGMHRLQQPANTPAPAQHRGIAQATKHARRQTAWPAAEAIIIGRVIAGDISRNRCDLETATLRTLDVREALAKSIHHLTDGMGAVSCCVLTKSTLHIYSVYASICAIQGHLPAR